MSPFVIFLFFHLLQCHAFEMLVVVFFLWKENLSFVVFVVTVVAFVMTVSCACITMSSAGIVI